jgi:cytosine/adenosine deaminase-related metal-dependent hydrolase
VIDTAAIRAHPSRASGMAERSTIFQAAHVLAPQGAIADAALRVERGLVRELVTSRARVRRLAAAGARVVDLGDGCIAPTFVDAHAHLELSGLGARVPAGDAPRDGSFTAWIRALLAARAQRGTDGLRDDARAGALRLLASGTTLVGDVDSSGAVGPATRGLSLRVRRYREVLDAGDPARTAAALKTLARRGRKSARLFDGISPHAPYTISAGLWTELGRVCRARRAHVMIHFAETAEETEWLEHGRGPMSKILAHAPHASGLDSIERAGLLGPRTVLVHGNRASKRERARIAESGAALVHCPGTHAFFRRERFDARAWLRDGVTLALGTDSLASNTDLDMRRELASFASAHPHIDPAVAFACATRNGARALGFAGRAGELVPGAWADFVHFEMESVRRAGVLDAIVHGRARLAGTWVGGHRAPGAGRI